MLPAALTADMHEPIVHSRLVHQEISRADGETWFAGRGSPEVPEAAKGVALFVGYLGYFFLLEWRWSTTPGKRMFGLFVQTIAGERCSLRAAAARTLLRVVEVNPLLLGMIPGGLIVMKSKRNQRLGDMIGGVVVAKRSVIETRAA